MYLEEIKESSSLCVIRPHLTWGIDFGLGQRELLDEFMTAHAVRTYALWYYTPMAMEFSRHLQPEVTIYDCMDELSGFLGAPPQLLEREQELLKSANVVFTGGISLYEAKCKLHSNIHPYPSSIDRDHFSRAAEVAGEKLHVPDDQSRIPLPRAGFYGVLDERFDRDLLASVAALRPHIQFVILGPVVKIDPTDLPKSANIHYLGPKTYDELPVYLAGWDVALLPFAMNDATKYISPTKTPEYLAAGKPVVSTPIRDVVRGYGDAGLVQIAATAAEFAAALDRALLPQESSWRRAVANKLAQTSWDATWASMQSQIDRVLARRRRLTVARTEQKRVEITSETAPKVLSIATGNAAIAEKRRSRHTEHYDYLVVGAGFAGSILAERIASQIGKRVLLIDQRDHIGGNAYDHYNSDGILVHKYGPHIFHTNSEKVVTYLSRFTKWRPYEHRVVASVDGQLLPIPINLDTINCLYGLHLDAEGMKSFLNQRIKVPQHIRTSEDIVISRVGRELYEKFFRNYTRKQWGLDPSQLDSSVAGRIPVRFDHDNRYFTDSFQAMPLDGYTRMFERMLDNPKITIRTGVSYKDVAAAYKATEIIYTGPIDEYFNFRYGTLPYRSLRFHHETVNRATFQTAPVINHPNDHEYTRVTEFKYLTGQTHEKTSVVYEYPQASGDPYYPIPRQENTDLYNRYRDLAKRDGRVTFCGRLATYRYLNMDQVVGQALSLFEQIPLRVPVPVQDAYRSDRGDGPLLDKRSDAVGM